MSQPKQEPTEVCQQSNSRWSVELWCVDCGQLSSAACLDGHDIRELCSYRRRLSAPQQQALKELEEALGALRRQELQSLKRSVERFDRLQRRVRDCREGLRAGREPWDQLLQEADRLLKDLDLIKKQQLQQQPVQLKQQELMRPKEEQVLPPAEEKPQTPLRSTPPPPTAAARLTIHTPSEVSIGSLSDELLAHTFSFLGPRMLLRELRAVCQRWRKVALHQTAWRAQTVPEDRGSVMSKQALMKRFFQLVPWAGKLVLYSWRFYPEWLCWSAYAVEELILHLGSENVPCLMKFLKENVASDRLRKLTIIRSWNTRGDADVLSIVGDLHLDRLELGGPWDGRTLAASPDGARCPTRWGCGSLRRLAFNASSSSYPLLQSIVASRASSLEEITSVPEDFWSSHSVPWMARLADCTSLKRVSLPLAKEVGALSACTQLASLTLHVLPTGSTDNLEIAYVAMTDILRVATQLKSLRFVMHGSSPKVAICRIVMGIVTLIPYSVRVTHLERLKLPELGSHVTQLDRLEEVLPQLPHLRTLELADIPSDMLLGLINRKTVPNLTMLSWARDCRARKQDTGCFIRVLIEMVQRNPGLHAKAVCLNKSCCPKPYGCLTRRLGFYAHGLGEACPLHETGVNWLWVSKRVS